MRFENSLFWQIWMSTRPNLRHFGRDAGADADAGGIGKVGTPGEGFPTNHSKHSAYYVRARPCARGGT